MIRFGRVTASRRHFADLKLPLPFYQVGAQSQTAVPAAVKDAIVISQCCDNAANDYAAVVPIGLLGRLRDHQLQALLSPEPSRDGEVLTNYSLDYFRLEPIEGVIDDPGPGRYLVANLRRAS